LFRERGDENRDSVSDPKEPEIIKEMDCLELLAQSRIPMKLKISHFCLLVSNLIEEFVAQKQCDTFGGIRFLVSCSAH